MKHTENYSLPQWEKSDRIMMDDFNAMCSSIDSGIAQAQALAEEAQTTAETAQAEAEKLPYHLGRYTGAYAPQAINIGFRPRAVLISGEPSGSTTQSVEYSGFAYEDTLYALVQMTETGFSLSKDGSTYPRLNVSKREYRYIAFR